MNNDDIEFTVYIAKRGERGRWDSTVVFAADSADAKRRADDLIPGWYCYGVAQPLIHPGRECSPDCAEYGCASWTACDPPNGG